MGDSVQLFNYRTQERLPLNESDSLRRFVRYACAKGEFQMSDSNHNDLSQRSWITAEIGWLSVCIIAAAWGHRLLPDGWQNVWGAFGVFGLASALGLASIATAKRHAAAAANQR